MNYRKEKSIERKQRGRETHCLATLVNSNQIKRNNQGEPRYRSIRLRFKLGVITSASIQTISARIEARKLYVINQQRQTQTPSYDCLGLV